MKPIKITSRNIMFTQPMNIYALNIGLILGNQYNYIIDTGLGSGSIDPILEYIGSTAKPFIVVNTHSHWDHIWGNFMFPNSTIISSPLCYQLEDKYWERAIEELGHNIDDTVERCLPNLTFEGKLYFPADDITIFTSPGHTADSISVYDGVDKVLYAGDNIGDTEDTPVPYIETSLEIFRDLIATYQGYDFTTCVSGHNQPKGREILGQMEAGLQQAWENQPPMPDLE